MNEKTLAVKSFHVPFAVTRRLQSGREWRKTQTVCGLSGFSQDHCAEAMSVNLCMKPDGSDDSTHKALDKAKYPQEEVRWTFVNILIFLVLLNSRWPWILTTFSLCWCWRKFAGAGWSISL